MKINKRKTILVIVSALTVILISIVSISCMRMGPFSGSSDGIDDQGIEVFEVQKGNIFQIVSTTGSIGSEVQNTYTLQVSGEIISALEKGEIFRKGDILVEVDNSDGMLRLEQIEKDIKKSESSLKTAKINYKKALDANHISIQLAELNNELAQQKVEAAFTLLEGAEGNLRLVKEDALSTDSQIASARSQVNSAEGSYEQSLLSQSTTYWNNLNSTQGVKAQIELVKENINQSEIQLELTKMDSESAKKDLDDYILYAPYDGIVLSSDFEVGEQNGGNNMISILSNDFLIKATVSETDISKVSEGDEAYITLDAYPDNEFSGEVKKIIPISVDEGGIISFEIIIKFSDANEIEIYYGLSANVDIITEEAANVLFVPIQSVYKKNGKSYVDLLVSEQVEPENIAESVKKVEVTTGINDYYYIEITSGLKEGDIIVTSRI